MDTIVSFVLLVVFGYPLLAYHFASASLRRRVDTLEAKLQSLQTELQALRRQEPTAPMAKAPAPVSAPPPSPVPEQKAPPQPAVARPPQPVAVPTAVPPAQARPAAEPDDATPAAPPPVKPSVKPSVKPPLKQPIPQPVRKAEAPAWLRAIRTWLFTGNLVAKLGLLILFIGVSFLLKLAAERVSVPIELRLAGIVVADIALLAWGWRLRLSRPGLSLPIQGAALGILMLVTFGAFRLYGLLPAGAAFALLFVLTAFTCILAVLQNALWLAVFGIAGGFVAPILTSTGQGSHVALFSYYALLNAGVLAIALKRTWRALNLLGFAFTFVIGAS